MRLKELFMLAVAGIAMSAFATGDYSTWVWQSKSDTNENPSVWSGFSFGGSAFW